MVCPGILKGSILFMNSSGNDLLRDLLGQMEGRYLDESSKLTTSEWVIQNTTLRGRPFSFKGYEFQRAILDDQSRELVVVKPSQCGLSEIQVRKALAFVRRNQGVSSLLSLPTEEMYKRFSNTRIKPMVEGERAFNLEDDGKAVRSMSMIQLGSSFLYITGCTEKDATSLPLDFLLHDELDLSPQPIISLFASRLQNSDYKITQKFSTPTHRNILIDKAYNISDQHEYFVKCDACNHQQVPLFERRFIHIDGLPSGVEDLMRIDEDMLGSMDLINARVICEKCSAPLDLTSPTREWVSKYPSRTSNRGYRVGPFSTSRLSIEYIVSRLLKAKSMDDLKSFSNTVLGQAYDSSDTRIMESDILACLGSPETPFISTDIPVFIGIDVGIVCHLVLGAPGKGAFHFETVFAEDLEHRVTELMKKYRIVGGAVDRHPYLPTANALRDLSRGIIMPVEYRGTSPIGFVKNEYGVITHAQCNRTEVIDEVAKSIRRHTLNMEGYGDLKSMLVNHLQDMVRVEEPDKPAGWVKISNFDHFFHSLAFMLFSIRLRGAIDELMIKDVRTTVGLFGIESEPRKDEMLPMRRGGHSEFGMRRSNSLF